MQFSCLSKSDLSTNQCLEGNSVQREAEDIYRIYERYMGEGYLSYA